MKVGEFEQLAAQFVARPTIPRGGERHVYLWHGEADALERRLPRGATTRLDLHQLAKTLPRKPSERDGARQVLQEALEQTLSTQDTEHPRQEIVLVTGCDLLMRYALSLGPLFQTASDTRMVVLVAPPYSPPSAPLPRYVDFHADATLEYLRSRISDAAVVH